MSTVDRGVAFLLLSTLLASMLFAQPGLIRGDPNQAPTLFGFAGAIQPHSIAAEPATRITVVVFPQTIQQDQRTRTAEELASLYKEAGQPNPLALVVFTGQEFTTASSFPTVSLWQKAVREALTPGPIETPPVPVRRLYATLAAASVNFGDSWSSLLLVGRLPEVEADLQEYAQAWLAARFCSQKLRVSYWNPGGGNSEFWNAMAEATAGIVGLDGMADLIPLSRSRVFTELSWPAPPWDRGFLLYRAELHDRLGAKLKDLPVLATAAAAQLPDIDSYAELRRAAGKAAALVHVENLDPAQPPEVRSLLEQALRINPLDGEALRTGAAYYLRNKDFKTAASQLASLTQIKPGDAGLYVELGHCLFTAGDLDGAERALLRARDSKVGGSTVPEELARIRLARQDDRGALQFLDETLALDSHDSELWFMRADAASRLGDWLRTADSLEKGLAVDEQNLKRRTSLVSLYLDHTAGDRALRHIQLVTAALPADAAVRRQYAEFLDRLGRPEDALAIWKRALESGPAMEIAHFRVARILLDRGVLSDALTAAARGLEAIPDSPRLILLKSEALERQGLYFEARSTLRTASKSLKDLSLLARLADMEDISGSSAAQAYSALIAAREKAGQDSPEAVQSLERGLEVAVRDGDRNSQIAFSALLAGLGKHRLAGLPAAEPAETVTAGSLVPGGLDALAFIAQSHFDSPHHVFADYCRTLVDRSPIGDIRQATAYLESVRQYFKLVATLRPLGTRKGDRAEFLVSAADKNARQKSEKILEVLGWKLRLKKDEVTLEAGEGVTQSRRQETASALAIDEAGMQEALQNGRTFNFEIVDARAPVLLGESKWLSAFFPKESFDGGFAEALTRDLRVAKTYAALSAMSSRAVAALTAGADLKLLVEKHAELLYRYASGFALRGGHAAVPGGQPAEPVWEKLVGSPVSNPAPFFRALLEKDDGKLLAFFANLGELDISHQRFFTRTQSRTSRFYELFRDSRDVAQGAEKQRPVSTFVEFFREIPLDSHENVLFPGSPEVWMLAKGNSSSPSQTAKMAKRLSRIIAPEQEDEILVRLAKTSYAGANQRVTELDNFVAVVRIDQHRSHPLDETSALLLAQHYAVDQAVYPYLAELTALEQPQFERFFGLMDQLPNIPRPQLNVILGEIDALIELLCLAQESGALPPKTAAELFGLVCERFAKAASDADYTSASLNTLVELLNGAAPKDAAGDPDRALEHALFSEGGPVAFDLGGVRREINPYANRSANYRKVLAEQKVTSLKALLDFFGALQALAQGKGSAADQLKSLDMLRGSLLTVELPKDVKADAIDRKILAEYDDARIGALIAHLKQRTSRKKVDRQEVGKLCQDLLGAIGPQVKVALSGVIYAYFLSPGDLLVSQDPLFLRKHRYLDLDPADKGLLIPSDLRAISQGAGSHVEGGFAGFSIVAGKVAMSGVKSGPHSEFAANAQIGSLRATDWNWLGQQDLLFFGLRLRLAREWVLHADADESLLSGLADDTLGLLSPNRRAQLLEAIAERDWDGAFKTMTLGDLYGLSGRYLQRYPVDLWQSPVTLALRRMAPEADDGRLRRLGSSNTGLLGCDHSHLALLGPYEEYEKFVIPYKLAERTAEFKLYLADLAGRAGIPPAALNLLGEPAALQLLAKAHMNDIRDWRALNLAFAGLDESVFLTTLEKQK